MKMSTSTVMSTVLLAGTAAASLGINPVNAVADALRSPYSGPLRPQAHFSPPQNFMNDPCGCFQDVRGVWHLYYQYNPQGLVAGNQHWAHVTSSDLWHWTAAEPPIALSPPDMDSQVFDGSIVIDTDNTSGFFPNQTDGVVAIYTLNTSDREVQQLAYSRDGGYTFEQYDVGNPILDVGSAQFRDPKVSRVDGRWVMVVAFAEDRAIGFYTSGDLKKWTHASNFTFPAMSVGEGAQWECPNLVEMPVHRGHASSLSKDPEIKTMFVLKLSINPGAPLGGSADVYFVGTFNGTHFTSVDDVVHFAEFAKDEYAAQFFYQAPTHSHPAEAISIGWASNWQYAQDVPTDREGWRSAMTVPRRNCLQPLCEDGVARWQVVQLPYGVHAVLGDELSTMRTLENGSRRVEIDFGPTRVASNAVYFELMVTATGFGAPYSDSADEKASPRLSFAALSTVSGESLAGSYNLTSRSSFNGTDVFTLDRGNIRGFAHPDLTPMFSTSIPRDITDPAASDFGRSWSVTIEGIIDRSVMEVFLDGGKQVATMVYFPLKPLTLFVVDSNGMPSGIRVTVRVWAVNSVWN